MPYRTEGSSALAPDDFSGSSPLDDAWNAAGAGASSGSDSNIVQFPGNHSSNSSNSANNSGGNIIHNDDWGNRQARRAAAREKAKAGESAASGKADGANSGSLSPTQTAKTAENSVGGSSGVKNGTTKRRADTRNNSINQAKAVNAKDLFSKNIKKYGPLGIIVALLALIGVGLSLSMTLAPFGLINNFMDNYNFLRTSSNLRSNVLIPRLLDSRDYNHTSVLKTKIFSADKFKISKKMQSKLRNQGVFYDQNNHILIYTDPDTGKTFGISSDKKNVSKIPDSVDIDDGNGNIRHFDIDPDAKMSYRDALDTNDNFFAAAETGTRTLRGHIAGWFDSISEKFHDRIGNTRNRQGSTKTGADADEVEANARKGGMPEEDTKNIPDNQYEEGKQKVPQADGTETEEPILVNSRDNSDGGFDTAGNDASLTKGMSEVEVGTSLSARAKSAAASFGKAAKAGQAATIACTGFKIINSLIQTITALQRAGILNFGTGIFEIIQKAQAGDSSTELMITMNKLFATDPDTGFSAFSSPAINQAFADGAVRVGSDDEYAMQLNTSNLSNQLIGADSNNVFKGVAADFLNGINEYINSLGTYKTCVGMRATSSINGILLDGATIAGELFLAVPTGGLSVVFTIISKFLAEGLLEIMAFQAIISGVMAFVTKFLIPNATKILARDLISKDARGAILGYALDAAANMYMGKQMQSATGIPATEASLSAQYEETQKVIASEARYIRNTHSPFDPSSKYTFLGSIVNSLTPIATSLSSPLSVISNATSLVGSAITSILPTANAASVVGIKTSLNHNCGSISQVTDDNGDPLICDAYGTSYYTDDYSTIAADPLDVMEAVALDADQNRNFVDAAYDDASYDGNPEIRERSTLGTYIVACTLSDVDPGQENPAVMAYIKGNNSIKEALTTLSGSVPFWGDAMDTGEAATEMANVGWITGENCVKSEYKYYARYISDQRWLESAGVITDSAVTAFIDKYYEKYPLDNSLEGIIARYSGQTKEEVELALGYLEYMNYVANYNPSGALPLGEKEEHQYVYDSETIVATDRAPIIKPAYIIYDDLRNRVKIA